MLIRRTSTRTSADGRTCIVRRLAHSVRNSNRGRNYSLLYLGRNFQSEQLQWKPVCRTIVERFRRESILLPGLPEPVEKGAKRIAVQLMASEPFVEICRGRKPDWRMVDVNAV